MKKAFLMLAVAAFGMAMFSCTSKAEQAEATEAVETVVEEVVECNDTTCTGDSCTNACDTTCTADSATVVTEQA